jgi:hypothetical protein
MNIGVWKNLILSVISLSNAEWNNNSHFTNLNLLQTTGTMIIGNFCIECHLHLHSISTNELSFNVWMDGWMDYKSFARSYQDALLQAHPPPESKKISTGTDTGTRNGMNRDPLVWAYFS